MANITSFTDEALITLDNIGDRASSLLDPSLRIGVTGLSRAGKTVFITALVHNLLHQGRLPLFSAQHDGRIVKTYLEQQPDDVVPRFQYEDHIKALLKDRIWPDSTRSISQLRLTVEYKSNSSLPSFLKSNRLSIDIVDYPGEWLLDLPLLGKSYEEFCSDAFRLAQNSARSALAKDFLKQTKTIEPSQDFDEVTARDLAESFTHYLRACRDDAHSLSMLPPGRFLMPGDLEGSPALTFAPIPLEENGRYKSNSLAGAMERRFEAYKTHVIKPFFREHIARLDRQIVLVDALQAMNAGPEALNDLEEALSEILTCFRPGTTNLLTQLFTRRIDKVLVCATKADHLHHENHDRLQSAVTRLVRSSAERAGMAGANIATIALAAIRATTEGTVEQDGEELPVIIGTPKQDEKIGGKTFDGEKKTAIFPGDLPENLDSLFEPVESKSEAPQQGEELLRFVRFRPPLLEKTADSEEPKLPHIRLDRALEFLLGDYLA